MAFHVGAQAACNSNGAQPAPSVEGVFAGGDGGVTSTGDMVTSQDTANLLALFLAGRKLKSLNLGLGTVTLQ